MTDKKINQKNEIKKEPKKEMAQSVRGMRDIFNEDYYYYQGFFEKAQEVAMYYGFKPIETPIMEQEALWTSGIGEGTDIIDKEMYTLKTKGGDKLAIRPEYTASIMRAYFEKGMQSLPQPVMLYSYGPVYRHDNPQNGRYREFRQFNLEILGTEKSIADALIIKTAVSILKEAGAQEIIVDINSIGDKESRPVYIKELVNYYKKHIADLSPIDRERLKTNPLRILDSKDPRTIKINENAPDSIASLSSAGKKHFKQVLEYLDQMNIAYRINKNLVRGLSYYSHTVFEILETSGGTDVTPLAIGGGGRYDYLAKTLGAKKDVPAMGMAIGVDRVVEATWFKKLEPRIMKKPKIYFIQLGFEAKLKSLNVVEQLRMAHIPIMQSISKDTLGIQLAIAEKSGAPYALIFGHKEAIDNTVIVRDMQNRKQETIKLDHLAEYLKKLK
ncbi:histidine--tRNA ligase [Candidatus Nomurabacteria bacterium RIFCSPHIGHO2_02_FULL_38_15]|uniref:Histidine--tRNA ligase n=1 Tax=Candidatus Nomurabacteria bacterium RIFCSPHIGHO2_02_FULL_38_15 TaxID=1801752 RepID=A0A1F6VRW7_9BACT|nr:MAG: histidine--tRNA ligase [Candidatus Nomurabacteria bacterium RIFCSPHIGHO2_02_FULL_38_15]